MKKINFLLIFLLIACADHDDLYEISVVHDYVKSRLETPNSAKFTNNDIVTHNNNDNTWTVTGTVIDVDFDGHPRYKFDVTIDQDDKLVQHDIDP